MYTTAATYGTEQDRMIFGEKSDHLGNVRAVVSDIRKPTNTNGSIDTWTWQADITDYFSYYPFGMLEPGRQKRLNTVDAGGYRFGFNSMEKDDEISGTGNSYTAEYWQYDARLGRRWNIDPKPNPSISNYACFADNPIMFSDPLGDTVVNPYQEGTKEYQKVQHAIDVVKRTNTNLYETLHKNEINYEIWLPSLKSKTSSNDVDRSDETGTITDINMNRQLTKTTEQGFYKPDMKGPISLKDKDSDPYNESGYTIPVYDYETSTMVDKSLSSEEANNYITLESTQIIELNKYLGKKRMAKVLAHEMGHAKFTLLNKAKQWFSESVSGYNLGHEPGNPSGTAAENAETDFDSNIKSTKTEMKKEGTW